ncbi:hypothetical protein P691DRAFT_296013 [Macrolepiota fuliginosa MF-IS2]|uniref:Uncharacterized protein n=1 Tax=Macrolepiota fuliginosa MF-IS2 TaxID=1400762 RepID=A0A9P5XLI7_9AGAR|nr:hypothetical protein P691DRAFT_296013 [Macrolepiota fuliginosa MF-IS2]
MPFFPGPIFNHNEPYSYPEMPGTSLQTPCCANPSFNWRFLTLGASSSVFGEMFNYGHGVSMNSHNDMGIMSINGIYPPETHQSLHNPALGTFDGLPDFTAFPNDSYSEHSAPHFHPPSQHVPNIDQILIEFNNARKMLFRFDAYGAVSNITYNVSDLHRTQEL